MNQNKQETLEALVIVVVAVALIILVSGILRAEELPTQRGCWQDDGGAIMHCPSTRDSCEYILGDHHIGQWVRYNCPKCPEDCGPYEEPPIGPPSPTETVYTYIVTVVMDNGEVIRTTALSTGECWRDDACNSNLRIQVRGNHPIDDTYRGVTSLRSSGQLDTIIEPEETP